MGDGNELIIGGGGTALTLLGWALNRLIGKVDSEIEKLWGNAAETREQLQDLAILVARLEASQGKHK